MALVTVAPIPQSKWHGKKGKESFSRPKDIEVLYDEQTGRYATGLTPEEQQKYEELMKVDLSDTFKPDEPHPYFGSKAGTIRLPNHTVIFDTNKPAEYVKVKNMKASKFVANSMKEYNENKWPDATHVMLDETEEVEIKASKVRARNEATLLASKMTKEDKEGMVQIIEKKSVRGRTEDFVDVEIDAILQEKPEQFLAVAKMGKEDVRIRATVLEAIYRNVLTKEGTGVYYMGELIGLDVESAISWFKDPQNQKLKIAIIEKMLK